MKEVTAYKCDYCHKVFGRKVNAAQHESFCNNRPERRNCKTCVHGTIAIIGYYPDFGGEPTIEQRGPYCDHFDKPISDKPFFDDCDYFEDPFGGTRLDAPIPYTCQHYKYKGKAEWTNEDK